ncbi:hypothetical protein ACIP68_10235 [Streptomyces griseoviridis]
MPYDDLPGLRITVENGVATVTLDHPPLNLMDGVLLPSLRGFVNRVRHDTDVRVVVFDSADPEFLQRARRHGLPHRPGGAARRHSRRAHRRA